MYRKRPLKPLPKKTRDFGVVMEAMFRKDPELRRLVDEEHKAILVETKEETDQAWKDHEAMQLLRSGKVLSVVKPVVSFTMSAPPDMWNAGCGYSGSATAKDPADAIISAAKKGE